MAFRLPFTTYSPFRTAYRSTFIFFTNHNTSFSTGKRDWMRYAWRGFSNIAEPSYNHGLYKVRGKVCVNGKVVNKAGTPVSDEAVVEIIAEIPKYVCRAGHKLEAVIEQLEIDVTGKVALDSGLSTGGFTDCLLQYGASYVYGVDVGYGQVADKVRRDERVCVIERTNLRYLPGLPQQVDLVTLDLSFISILLVMPAVVKVMKERSTLITLVKPQFEARRSQVGSGGIVRDPEVHKEVLERIINGVQSFGFQSKGWIESPLKGAEGNTEFLVCFERSLRSAV
ncbi:putative rRNA methyltransferase YqxC [Bienertia sinuspersici]